MSTHKKKVILSGITVKLGCSTSCTRPKLSTVYQPKPRRRHHNLSKSSTANFCGNTDPNIPNNDYSSSSLDTATTTFSPTLHSSSDIDSDIKTLRAVQGFGRIDGESVAVEKDSSDPYLDFRQSMLQMILERDIYSKDDLKELLHCFLKLNSPYYHGIIVRAFAEIWHGVFSARRPAEVGSPTTVLHGGGGR